MVRVVLLATPVRIIASVLEPSTFQLEYPSNALFKINVSPPKAECFALTKTKAECY
jgi:hypothetical protein